MFDKLVVERNRIQWGHYAALVILSALAAAYQPHYLLYVGLARWAWCILGGRPLRGLGSALIFLLAYLGVTFTAFLESANEPTPAECIAPATDDTVP